MPVPRSFARSLDFSRSREGFRGYPKNSISYGTVGHVDLTPQYVRIENGDVLVEVTLEPTGDEIVARLDTSSVDGGAMYWPLSYGQRVVVAFPGTGNGDPVIVGRCSDASWPFPSSVAGVSTSVLGSAPMFAIMKTADGQLLAIETGDGGDILIHSGGSAQVRVGPGEQALITGRTHIGSQAKFTSPPTGGSSTAGGFVQPGVGAAPYVPVPNDTVAFDGTLLPPAVVPYPAPQMDGTLRPIPEDGVVRMKDTVQINSLTASAFFAWLAAVDGIVRPLVGPTMPALPAGINGQPISASLNTVTDD